jgi:hypothetical protein
MNGANAEPLPITKIGPSKNTIGMSQNFLRTRRKLQNMTAGMERTRRDETEEHEHHTWYQELIPGCLMRKRNHPPNSKNPPPTTSGNFRRSQVVVESCWRYGIMIAQPLLTVNGDGQ